MRNRFDEMLDELNEELIRMGSLCEEAIETSVRVLKYDEDTIATVSRLEDEINQMEQKIEDMCMKLLLRQQPVAKDLRLISSALKMISDMERIGDQAQDIAEIAKYVNMSNRHERLDDMTKAAKKMVTEAIDSFVKKDLELAGKVVLYDDVVDDLFIEIKKEVIENIASHKEDGESLADLLMIAKYLERIGDHAVNIAQWVEYSMTGKHE